ncbi:MAG: GNAT family N-acetyltransferase [Pirellulales bacterium]|nr:GNAT family N-acetyltransferase [Planctomycetales bacterium]
MDEQHGKDLSLETCRLVLQAHEPAEIVALVDGNDTYRNVSGLEPASGLREFFVSGELSPDWLAQLRAAEKADPWKWGFALLLRGTNLVVGTCGFKGPADGEGVVEIGYGIVADHQGRGFASEATAALVAFASTCGDVRRLRAHTLPEANASTRVLSKCGFEFIGDVIDPDDGPVWRWERDPEQR